MRKKVFSVIMSLVLVLTLMPGPYFASANDDEMMMPVSDTPMEGIDDGYLEYGVDDERA